MTLIEFYNADEMVGLPALFLNPHFYFVPVRIGEEQIRFG